MSVKDAGKGILRMKYKAETAPLQVANAIGKAVAPGSKVSKALDSVANPRILNKKGGKVSRYGMKHGGVAGAMPKGKPC